jgi:hypothetical protein
VGQLDRLVEDIRAAGHNVHPVEIA